jgi:hypothetical protein
VHAKARLIYASVAPICVGGPLRRQEQSKLFQIVLELAAKLLLRETVERRAGVRIVRYLHRGHARMLIRRQRALAHLYEKIADSCEIKNFYTLHFTF